MLRNVMAIDNGKIIGIQSAASGVSYDNTNSGLNSTNVQDAINEVCDDLSDKVDKVAGKGLSTNDYDDTAKGIVDGVTSALASKASTNDLGDKSNLTTTDKSSCVGAINEVNGNFNNLKYHKIAESASTGTYAQKLQSLATAYNTLTINQRRSAILVINDADVYTSINITGNWSSVWVDSTAAYLSRYGIDGSAYVETGGTVTDNSSNENTNVFAIWVCEP